VLIMSEWSYDLQCEAHYKHEIPSVRMIHAGTKVITPIIDFNGSTTKCFLLCTLYNMHLLNVLKQRAFIGKNTTESGYGPAIK
jgi:hypothetical protein